MAKAKEIKLKTIADLAFQFSDYRQAKRRQRLCKRLNMLKVLSVVAGRREADVRRRMLWEYFKPMTPGQNDYYWVTYKRDENMGDSVAMQLRLDGFLAYFVKETRYPEGYEDRYLHLKKTIELLLNELDARLELFNDDDPFSSMGLLPVRLVLIRKIIVATKLRDMRELTTLTEKELAKLINGLGPKGAKSVVDCATRAKQLSVPEQP